MKIACVGSGYFAKFHIEAWKRLEEVELVALCDVNVTKAKEMAGKYGISRVYGNLETMLDAEELEVVDVITPPDTHLELGGQILNRGLDMICQKPLAPTYEEAKSLVELSEKNNRRFMVHENFRFQPWYRKIKSLLETKAIGERVHTLSLVMRMGDGWGPKAYLDRQPYFQKMPRLLIYETGIHYIDVFRFLAGEISQVYARLRKLNPVIAGEDCALVLLDFENGGLGTIDGNRYNDSHSEDPRYTFGETTVEGDGGTIRLWSDGTITVQKLGGREVTQTYDHCEKNFASDCVYHTQKHFVDAYLSGKAFETNGPDYLKNIIVQEAIYESAQSGRSVRINPDPDQMPFRH